MVLLLFFKKKVVKKHYLIIQKKAFIRYLEMGAAVDYSEDCGGLNEKYTETHVFDQEIPLSPFPGLFSTRSQVTAV